MDENKRVRLIEVGYEVRACGVCEHFDRYSDPYFGDCKVHSYRHIKHSGGDRPLSVTMYGSCPNFRLNQSWASRLHGFAEFTKEST